MKTYIDTATGQPWQFDPDVVVKGNQFFDARGNRLNVPETLIPGELPEPVAPEPQFKTQFSVLDFRDRFTTDEQIAIRQAQLTDMEVGLVYDSFISAQFIDITDPRVAGGIDLYISKGLLEPDRKEALLEPELIPPPEAA